MHSIRTAALAATCLLAATAAHAETTLTVDHVTITGSKTVPESTLRAAIQAHPGARMTKDDIVADQATILKILADASVGGGIKTSMTTKGTHVDITFIIDDQGVQKAVVTKVAPKLAAQMFAGNTKITSADLEAATGLKVGDELTNARVQAAQKGIAELYQKRKKVNASIQGAVKTDAKGQVEIDWQITESKLKEKPSEPQDDSGYGATGE